MSGVVRFSENERSWHHLCLHLDAHLVAQHWLGEVEPPLAAPDCGRRGEAKLRGVLELRLAPSDCRLGREIK